jgi:hypothetical protein
MGKRKRNATIHVTPYYLFRTLTCDRGEEITNTDFSEKGTHKFLKRLQAESTGSLFPLLPFPF